MLAEVHKRFKEKIPLLHPLDDMKIPVRWLSWPWDALDESWGVRGDHKLSLWL